MKIYLIVAILLVILISNVEAIPITFELKNVNTGSEIEEVFVEFFINGEKIEEIFLEESFLILNVTTNKFLLEIKADNFKTEGMDYYYNNEVVLNEESITIFLFEVGSLNGIVMDDLENLVSGVDLKFMCILPSKFEFPEKTDQFGSFFVENAPVGNCKILVAYKKSKGVADILIEKGSMKEVSINLTKKRDTISNKGKFFLFIIFILGIFLVMSYLKNKKLQGSKKNKKLSSGIQKRKKLHPKGKTSLRLKDIIETLTEREKGITNFILSEGGKTTSSKIYYKLKIPKSSLFRNLQALERRKVIEINKIGKVKHIKLTRWVMEKEGST